MPLSSRVKNKLIDTINMVFSDIGATPDTRPPKSKDNRAPIAWEYFLSAHLLARAKGRFNAARSAAIKSGIIFDHEKFPRPPGTSELIYAGDQVGVFLTVKSPSLRVDADVLVKFLDDRGVDSKLLAQAYEAASVRTKPAHEFRTTLVVTDNMPAK